MSTPIKLKKAIEEKLVWGPAEEWTNYDFEKLSEEIHRVTAISLSVSTLKRFFGKVKYGNSPSITTLNTLATFVGYDDWRHFESKTEGSSQQESPEAIPRKAHSIKGYLFSGMFVLLIVFGLIYFKTRPRYNPDDFTFSSKTVLSSGLPNSVIFDYDVSRMKDPDTAFISQNWDVRRKFAIDKKAKHHSSIYYYPGYFRAKLMANDQILQEHDIQITTDGWLGLVTAPWGEPPLYFDQAEIMTKEAVRVNEELLQKYEVSLFPELPEVRLYNQADLKNFYTDNFGFETEVKSGYSEGKGACQRVDILLQSKDDVLILPLARPACVGDLFLVAYGVGAGSQNEDLSGLGCDLNDWVKVRIVCTDRQIRFYVNDKLAYQTRIANPPNEIVGVQYRFEGPGAVRNTKLVSGENVFLFD